MFLASVIKIVTSVTVNDEQTHRYRHRDTSHLRMAVPKVKRILLFDWDSMMHKSSAGSLPVEDKNWIIGISLGCSHLTSILFTCKSTVIQVPPETIWNVATAVPGAGSPGGGRRRITGLLLPLLPHLKISVLLYSCFCQLMSTSHPQDTIQSHYALWKFGEWILSSVFTKCSQLGNFIGN